MPELPAITAPRRLIGGREFDFDRRVAVMAIVNRTRDSFFDAGRTYELAPAVEAALAAAEAGADIVDVGGVPFSPIAREVGEAEEIDRVVPVISEAEPAVLAAGARVHEHQPSEDGGFKVYLDPAGHPFCLSGKP